MFNVNLYQQNLFFAPDRKQKSGMQIFFFIDIKQATTMPILYHIINILYYDFNICYINKLLKMPVDGGKLEIRLDFADYVIIFTIIV